MVNCVDRYKDDPIQAAKSLDPLLQKAVARIPASKRAATPLGLGATAGLRMIGQEKADRILEAVRSHIASNYEFQVNREEDIRILDGNEEGK